MQSHIDRASLARATLGIGNPFHKSTLIKRTPYEVEPEIETFFYTSTLRAVREPNGMESALFC